MTIIGPDRTGLVESVARVVAEHGGNWLESRMCRLGGEFAGILRIELPVEKRQALIDALQILQGRGLTVVVRPGEVAATAPGSTVVRTAWVSGAHGANMVKTVLRLAAAGTGPLRFVDDQRGTPTFTADLAPTIVRLALDRRPGTFHVTNHGETTWFGFARAVLAAAGLDPERVEPIGTDDLDPPRPAPRPANSRLDNAALRLSGLPALPEWTDALDRLVGVLTDVAATA